MPLYSGVPEMLRVKVSSVHERNKTEQKIFDKLPRIFGNEVEGWRKENSNGGQVAT